MSLESINRRVVRCTRCPELRTYCAQVAAEKKRAYRDWTYWGKPVPSFGDPNARLLLIGLAPGAHGSNRTGRPFTGDGSGNFLYPALHRAGFATQATAVSREDGMKLRNCYITSVGRCAPPKNKPTPQELHNCFPYLVEEFDALPELRVIVTLGSIALKGTLELLRIREFALSPERPKFGHLFEFLARKGARTIAVINSFHPSQQNTNTGKLTVAMFDAVFTRAKELLRI